MRKEKQKSLVVSIMWLVQTAGYLKSGAQVLISGSSHFLSTWSNIETKESCFSRTYIQLLRFLTILLFWKGTSFC